MCVALYVSKLLFSCCCVQYMLRHVCIHCLCICPAEGKYVCSCAHVVFVSKRSPASDPDGPAPGEGRARRGREGIKEKKKNKRVQSSEADDCVFVRANLFITDAREISIEMILVTDSPWISPMADTQNVYVYRS